MENSQSITRRLSKDDRRPQPVSDRHGNQTLRACLGGRSSTACSKCLGRRQVREIGMSCGGFGEIGQAAEDAATVVADRGVRIFGMAGMPDISGCDIHGRGILVQGGMHG